MPAGSTTTPRVILSREAFRAAADPAKYPEQIREGLHPWQPRKYYYPVQGGRGGGPAPASPLPSLTTAVFDISAYDVLLGRTYTEMGSEERSMHKCQGMAQLLPLPSGGATSRYLLMDSFVGDGAGGERSLFDGIDTTVPGLAKLVPGAAPAPLVDGLRAIADAVAAAQRAFDTGGAYAAAPALAAGLTATRSMRRQLSVLSLPDEGRFDIDARLDTKEREFVRALLVASGVRVDVLADDGLVVPGEAVRVTANVGNRGPRAVAVKQIALSGFDGAAACASQPVQPASAYRCESPISIPAAAEPTRLYWKRLPDAARYAFDPDAPFGLPFRPSPFRARVTLEASGAEVALDLPVQYRYEGADLEGEKRMELTVVPKVEVRVAPDIAVAPTGSGGSPAAVEREIRVRLTNHDKGPTSGQVTLETPAGWTMTPAASELSFTREDEERTVRFTVRPAASARPGDYTLAAAATAGAQVFTTGYQVVEYPHTTRRQLEIAANIDFKVLAVKVPPNLSVGYVMGSGDEVPLALRQLGASVEMLGPDELAWGDLARFDAIVTGVRAYEKRPDLIANNRRLLDYASNGGTVIVQYNRHDRSGFNDTRPAPYPARATIGRVSDENAEVRLLAAADPVFHFPNEIGPEAWKGWVQERGTYFLEPQDPHYVDLLELYEPFENNRGWKRGALVEARVGKGRWFYVGLGLWRQTAAGVDGAFEILANLVSAGRAR